MSDSLILHTKYGTFRYTLKDRLDLNLAFELDDYDEDTMDDLDDWTRGYFEYLKEEG